MQKRHLSIRFLIGLGDPTDRELEHEWATLTNPDERSALRRVRADSILGRAYDCGGAYFGEGLWRGNVEHCMQFETIVEDQPLARNDARLVASTLASSLGQDAVGLVFTPVEFEEVE
jgi:hypothetical protein